MSYLISIQTTPEASIQGYFALPFQYRHILSQSKLLRMSVLGLGLQCRIMWQFKPKTIIARLLANLAIIYSVFYNPDLMEKVCGPFTLPISHKHHLLIVIALMEVLRIVYSNLIQLLRNWGVIQKQKYMLLEMLTTKYMFLFIIKIWFIFDQSHRKKFYLHTLLLQGAILGAAILFDCFSKENIKEVGELLIVQGLYRLALVYVLTQTFCPNLILYYSITNLLVFILSQVEAQSRYGLNKSLYVKHDIYRFLFLSLIFFFLTSVTQVSSYGFKMLVVFFLSLRWHIGALRDYQQNKFSRASWELTGVIIFLSLGQIFYSLFDG